MSQVNAMSLSPRETELLAATWQCFEGGPPKVDYVKLAAITGYTHKSAIYALGQLKTKLKRHMDNTNNTSGNNAPATPKSNIKKKTPASGTKRSAPAAAQDTPSKKSKTNVAGAGQGLELEDEDKEIKVKAEMLDDDVVGDSFFPVV